MSMAKWRWFGTAAFTLLCALWIGALSAQADSEVAVKSDAQIAGDLGLLKGDGNGLTQAYLAKTTTRIQAAIIDLRLKGLEQEAIGFTGSANFADADQVEGGNRKLLAYLKAHPELGWEGVGDNRFDPLSPISSQQFYKVMLGSLGYASGADFDYSDTLSFAKSKGLYQVAGEMTFHNRDLATAIVESLQASPKGSSDTQANALSQKGLVNASVLSELGWTKLSVAQNDTLGQYLVDGEGRTLYYFTKDAADLNACQGKCLSVWPIYDAGKLRVPASLDPADFGRFTRKDGTMQITYKGWPVYYYAEDEAPGDVKGENVNKVWFVFKVPAYTVAIGTKADLGNYLTDSKGRTLYYFDKDTMNKSNCSGACEKLWPAFYADSAVVPTGVDPSDFGVITRADGSLQTTYKGYPLYYFAQDSARGDTAGQGYKDVWFVVSPATFNGTTAGSK